MKKFLLAICFSACHLLSFAQVEYPLVTQGAKYYTDGSEIYYLETSFNKKKGFYDEYNLNTQFIKDCYDTIAWIGKVKKDSVNLDFTISVANNVSVSTGKIGMLMIEPWKKSGVKSLALDLSSGNQVWSEIKDVKWESFLGVSDSVKTITFYLKQPSSLPEEKMYDSLYYKISRKYGIIETRLLECEQISGLLRPNSGFVGNKIKTIGIQNEKLGWKPKGLYQFNDYKVGDRLYFSESNDKSHGYTIPCIGSRDLTIEILSKKLLKDTLSYGFIQSINNVIDSSCLFPMHYNFKGIFKIDSLVKINTPDKDGNFYYYDYKTSDSVMFKQERCPFIYGANSKYILGKGLVSIFEPTSWGQHQVDLKNYIIASLSKDDSRLQDLIVLSPNPASNSLYISSPVQGNLQLLNSSGVEILSSSIVIGNGNNINIANVAPGIYFYNVYSNQKLLKTGKLIVQ